MTNYLNHMEDLGQGTAFARRVGYLAYNFRHVIANLHAQNQVLEIGPGTGEFLHLLNQHGVTKIDIIDNDRAILGYCHKNFTLRSTKLSLSNKLVITPQPTYDLIILTQIFEHIPKKSYLNWLRVLYKSLKPGGQILITVPNGANPLVGTERYGDLQHENVFTIFSFQELMTFANLPHVSYLIKGFEIPPNSIINVIRIILQKTLHLFFVLLMIINGAIYQTLMTPNITLVIKKES